MFARSTPEGMLTVDRGDEEGYIVIERGRLRAQLGFSSGRQALEEMLSWQEGTFAFEGQVDESGMLIPFPSPPAVRKVAEETLQHVAAAVDPPAVPVEVVQEMAAGISRDAVPQPFRRFPLQNLIISLVFFASLGVAYGVGRVIAKRRGRSKIRVVKH